MTKPIYSSLATLACASLMCLIQFQDWHPYSLNGPQFLQYYAVVLLTAYIAFLLFKNNTRVEIKNAAISALIVIAAIGVARLFQGIFNNKPVGYLILMLLLHFIIIAIVKSQKQKGSK